MDMPGRISFRIAHNPARTNSGPGTISFFCILTRMITDIYG